LADIHRRRRRSFALQNQASFVNIIRCSACAGCPSQRFHRRPVVPLGQPWFGNVTELTPQFDKALSVFMPAPSPILLSLTSVSHRPWSCGLRSVVPWSLGPLVSPPVASLSSPESGHACDPCTLRCPTPTWSENAHTIPGDRRRVVQRCGSGRLTGSTQLAGEPKPLPVPAALRKRLPAKRPCLPVAAALAAPPNPEPPGAVRSAKAAPP